MKNEDPGIAGCFGENFHTIHDFLGHPVIPGIDKKNCKFIKLKKIWKIY